MAEAQVQKVEDLKKETMTVQELAKKVEELKRQIENIKPGAEDRVSIIVFSGDLDKVLAAFIIATGAVAMGMEAVMFFTFWGTPVLRDPKRKQAERISWGRCSASCFPKAEMRLNCQR